LLIKITKKFIFGKNNFINIKKNMMGRSTAFRIVYQNDRFIAG